MAEESAQMNVGAERHNPTQHEISALVPGSNRLKPQRGDLFISVAAFLSFVSTVSAAIFHVDPSSTNPVPPYADWATAATNIQEAVDAASTGDTVWVTNGVYNTGGRVVYGSLTNRLVVAKPVTLRSVNGPAVTIIEGSLPGGTNGPSAVRCAHLASGAAVFGFTFSAGGTAGHTNLSSGSYPNGGASTNQLTGGGVWCESSSVLVSNCWLKGNSAQYYGGGAFGGTLVSCVLASNVSYLKGGGAYSCVLKDCTLSNNSALFHPGLSEFQLPAGGGAAGSSATNCVLLGNLAQAGGGVDHCTVSDSVLVANTAYKGGGANYSTLFDCEISTNTCLFGNGGWVAIGGGGAADSTLVNCTLLGNCATNPGGGAFQSSLTNCVVAGNWAKWSGGGTASSILFDCVVANNVAASGSGGGTSGGNIYNCSISGNWCQGDGGGCSSASTVASCAIIGNRAGGCGGGVCYVPSLVNCLISSNVAGTGGGTFQCRLTNCVVSFNSATTNGGGICLGFLANSTVVGNIASNQAGGGWSPITRNSIIWSNSAPNAPNWVAGAYYYTCTDPLPTGLGNIDFDPLLAALQNADFHLSSNSPCINSGLNAYVTGDTDLDGSARVAGGTVDMGAYEFQSPGSGISYAWLQQYGMATDGSADATDPDLDGMNNWQEWRCSTVPTNTVSVLRMISATNSVSGIAVTWRSVAGISYAVQRCTAFGAQRGFETFTNVTGQAGQTSVMDTQQNGTGQVFYRIGVQ